MYNNDILNIYCSLDLLQAHFPVVWDSLAKLVKAFLDVSKSDLRLI